MGELETEPLRASSDSACHLTCRYQLSWPTPSSLVMSHVTTRQASRRRQTD
jgi:hypothetical protein